MSLANKERVEILKRAKVLLKENEREFIKGYPSLEGLCILINRAACQSNYANKYSSTVKDFPRLSQYKPDDYSFENYWWPRDLEHVAVREKVLDELIEYYSYTPWYKRLFNLFKN